MPMNVKCHPFSWAVLASLVWSAPATADESTELLAKMRSAVHTLSYSGTLVYAQGSALSTYQVQHDISTGEERDSVTRLSQSGNTSTPSAEGSFSLAKFQQVQPQMEQAYSLDRGGEESVAQQVCKIVVARPRDRMRYLQRYCIEPNSGMLLKYSLVDQSHKPVEQFMFTSLELKPAMAATALDTSKAALTETAANVTQDDGGWSFVGLPAGFQQVRNAQQPAATGKAEVRHIVLSDGMTSVSVFIAPPDSPGVAAPVSLSAGAMNIFTTILKGHKITLVGEVPVTTLESIGKALTYAK